MICVHCLLAAQPAGSSPSVAASTQQRAARTARLPAPSQRLTGLGGRVRVALLVLLAHLIHVKVIERVQLRDLADVVFEGDAQPQLVRRVGEPGVEVELLVSRQAQALGMAGLKCFQ